MKESDHDGIYTEAIEPIKMENIKKICDCMVSSTQSAPTTQLGQASSSGLVLESNGSGMTAPKPHRKVKHRPEIFKAAAVSQNSTVEYPTTAEEIIADVKRCTRNMSPDTILGRTNDTVSPYAFRK